MTPLGRSVLVLLPVLTVLFLVLWFLHRSVPGLLRLFLRLALSLGFLLLFSAFRKSLGIGLGVNLFNSGVLTLLGIPGFGLLILLSQLLK